VERFSHDFAKTCFREIMQCIRVTSFMLQTLPCSFSVLRASVVHLVLVSKGNRNDLVAPIVASYFIESTALSIAPEARDQ
jgi:hypothetical protein